MAENNTLNAPEEVLAVPPTDVVAEKAEKMAEAIDKAVTKKARKPKTKKTPAKPTKDQIIAQLKAENDHLKEIIESKDFAVKQITQRMDDLCKTYTDKTEYAMDMLTTCFKSIYREFKGER